MEKSTFLYFNFSFMFTSQKTFGVNPYFSAPSGAPEKAPEKPISPQEELAALQNAREQAYADFKTGDKTVKARAEKEMVRLDAKIAALQANTAEQAAQSSEQARKQIAATPGATSEERAAATQALGQETGVLTAELQDRKNAVAKETAAAQTTA